MAKPIVSLEKLKQVLFYCPVSGVFKNNVKRNPNKGLVSSRVGYIDKNGYLNIKIDGKSYLAHRLAWFYHYGKWPNEHIDHINHIRNDNRICNLRDISRSGNRQNIIKANNNNVAGLLGCYKKPYGYQAAIEIDGKRLYLGTFSTMIEAHNAYLDAKRKNHEYAVMELIV